MKPPENSSHRVVFKPGYLKQLITNALTKLKTTRIKLAEKLGVSDTTLYNYHREDPRRHPTWRLVKKLLEITGTPEEEALKHVEEFKQPNWGSRKPFNPPENTWIKPKENYLEKEIPENARIQLQPGHLHKLIEEARTKLNYTHRKLAETLGVKRRTISDWEHENQRRHPTWKHVKHIAKLLNIPEKELRKQIVEVKKPNWGSSKAAQIINTKYKNKKKEWAKENYPKTLGKYKHKLKQWAKLGPPALLKKYGREKLAEWGRKGAQILNTKYKQKAVEGARKGYMKGAYIGAARQKPTEQMKLFLVRNENLGLKYNEDFMLNYNIRVSKNEFKNYDIVYFDKKGNVKIVEELTAQVPDRQKNAIKALDIIRKRAVLPKTTYFFFIIPMNKKESRGFDIKIQPDLVFALFKEKIFIFF
ncbi:MAG: helix-turn-helix transcriptional regulator [Candidatus Odinarchaeia archaeon]